MPLGPGLALDAFDLQPEVVRARFVLAARRGHPTWLWPEVSVADWQAAVANLADAIAAILAGRQARITGAPAAIGVAAYSSGTGPLLGLWLDRGLLAADDDVAALLRLHLHHNRLRMAMLTAETTRLATALAAGGVRPTLLKGLHTARGYFPEAGARPVSDIDLLVEPANEPVAAAVLTELGYIAGRPSRGIPPQRDWRRLEASEAPRTLSFVHYRDPWSIDVQHSLNRRYAPGAPIARLDDLHGNGPAILGAATLPQPLLLLHLAVHAGCGFQNLTLIRLVELILVIRHDGESGALAWPAFLDAGRRAGALGMAFAALQLCEELAPGTVPVDALTACHDAAPARLRRLVARLTPATAHRVARRSFAEKFVWQRTGLGLARQLIAEIVPAQATSLAEAARIYRTRAMKLLPRAPLSSAAP
uniref:nucleotidyltransferase family protein n=1 Tax=Sphingomonas bacterium TaxID=1895847 RepID=UPI0026316E48|nr:nucleotidyltransferase family protein [Sphingomonas bacterium]